MVTINKNISIRRHLLSILATILFGASLFGFVHQEGEDRKWEFEQISIRKDSPFVLRFDLEEGAALQVNWTYAPRNREKVSLIHWKRFAARLIDERGFETEPLPFEPKDGLIEFEEVARKGSYKLVITYDNVVRDNFFLVLDQLEISWKGAGTEEPVSLEVLRMAVRPHLDRQALPSVSLVGQAGDTLEFQMEDSLASRFRMKVRPAVARFTWNKPWVISEENQGKFRFSFESLQEEPSFLETGLRMMPYKEPKAKEESSSGGGGGGGDQGPSIDELLEKIIEQQKRTEPLLPEEVETVTHHITLPAQLNLVEDPWKCQPLFRQTGDFFVCWVGQGAEALGRYEKKNEASSDLMFKANPGFPPERIEASANLLTKQAILEINRLRSWPAGTGFISGRTRPVAGPVPATGISYGFSSSASFSEISREHLKGKTIPQPSPLYDMHHGRYRKDLCFCSFNPRMVRQAKVCLTCKLYNFPSK